MSKDVIIIGGGASVQEGILSDLWNIIKDKEIWSLNSVFKVMPYNPTRQLWVDNSFFKHERDALVTLHTQGVKLTTVEYVTYSTLEFIQKYKAVRTFPKTDNEVFFGRMGLSGLFALSVAIKEGYDRCFVLGFDFGSVTNSNTTHWYQDKIKELNIKSNGAGNPGIYLNKGKLKEEVWDFSYYDTWKNKIYNVSPLSKIPNLNKINYQQFYELIKDSDGINAAS